MKRTAKSISLLTIVLTSSQHQRENTRLLQSVVISMAQKAVLFRNCAISTDKARVFSAMLHVTMKLYLNGGRIAKNYGSVICIWIHSDIQQKKKKSNYAP